MYIAPNKEERFIKQNEELSKICMMLRDIRKNAKITQVDIAKRTGLSQGTISKIENCQIKNISFYDISTYANGVGIDLYEVIKSYVYTAHI